MINDNYQKTLNDFFSLRRGTTYKSKLLGQSGPILLGLATIQRNGGFRRDSLQTYGGDSPDTLIVQPGELYLSLKDVTQSADLLGAVARLPRDQPPGRLTQDTVKLVPKGSHVPLDYLYWLLRTPQYRDYCRSYATGTTNLGFAREDFLAFPVPELNENRHQIVRILENLEEKIEINLKVNETLEAMARAIFKSWFVDFNPVRAKAEGKQPAGMNAETATLFPDGFEEVDGREVPRGWGVKPLDEIAIFLNGLALQKYPAESEDTFLPVIKIAQLHKGNIEGSDKASVNIPPEYIVNDGDVLFSWSGSLEVILWSGGRGALNQHLFKVSSESYPKWFYYYWVLHHLSDFQLIAEGKATTMGHIQRHHLSEAMVLVPPSDQIERMDKMMAPFVDRIVENAVESRTLAQIRDALLPKLMTGEINVSQENVVIR